MAVPSLCETWETTLQSSAPDPLPERGCCFVSTGTGSEPRCQVGGAGWALRARPFPAGRGPPHGAIRAGHRRALRWAGPESLPPLPRSPIMDSPRAGTHQGPLDAETEIGADRCTSTAYQEQVRAPGPLPLLGVGASAASVDRGPQDRGPQWNQHEGGGSSSLRGRWGQAHPRSWPSPARWESA